MNKVFCKFFCALSLITYVSFNFNMDPRHPIIEFGGSGNSQNNNNDSHSSLKDVHDSMIREHLSKPGYFPSSNRSAYNDYDDSDDDDDDEDDYDYNNGDFIKNFYNQPNEEDYLRSQNLLIGCGEGTGYIRADELDKLITIGLDKSKPGEPAEKEKSEPENCSSPSSASATTSEQVPSVQLSSLTYSISGFSSSGQLTNGTYSDQSSHASTTEPIQIDESEFENLPQSSSSDTTFSESVPSMPQVSYKGNSFRPGNIQSNAPKPSTRREFREQESFSGLDNIPWRDYEGERRAAEERERQRRVRTYNRINTFLKSETIPAHFKERLNEVVESNVQGEVDFDQTEGRFNEVEKDYKQTVLHELRMQENLSSDHLNLRRRLEFELLSSQDRSALYSDEYKNIIKEEKEDKRVNIYSWDIVTNNLRKLKDRYKARKKEYVNKSLDEISLRFKKQFQEEKWKLDKYKHFKKTQLNKPGVGFIKINPMFKDMAYVFMYDKFGNEQFNYLYLNPLIALCTQGLERIKAYYNGKKYSPRNKTLSYIPGYNRMREEQEKSLKYHKSKNKATTKRAVHTPDKLTFADAELIIVNDAFDPTITIPEASLDSLDLITTNHAQEFLGVAGIDAEEFYNFKGNAEQEDFHAKLTQSLEKNSAWHNASPIAQCITTAAQYVFKAAYDLNKANYSQLGQGFHELLEFLNPVLLLKTLENELVNSVSNPKGYAERRIQALQNYSLKQLMAVAQATRTIATQCKEISTLTSSNLSFLEKYKVIDNAVKTLIITTYELMPGGIKFSEAQELYDHFKDMPLEERRKFVAQTAIDIGVDYIVLTGLSVGINSLRSSLSARNIPKSHVYETTWEPLAKPEIDVLQVTEKALPQKSNRMTEGIRGQSTPESLVPNAEKLPKEILVENETKIISQANMLEKITKTARVEGAKEQVCFIEPESKILRIIDNEVICNKRSGSALKLDAYHAFYDIIDNYVEYAEKFDLYDTERIRKTLYQIEGSLNGIDGIFEWIVHPDPSKGVTHRLFIENGKISGKPNVWSTKK